MLFNAVALWPEVSIPTPNVNDDAEHAAFVSRASDALASGENVIDHWLPDIDLGFPEFFYYQHLPHLTVVALHRALLGTVDLFVVFNLVRWLLLVTLPLTVFWSMRTMGFSDVAAAIAGAAASLLSGDHRYGFEYDSYVWRGFGLYTQIWAMHLSFIGLALLQTLLTRGTGTLRTICALTVLALSHLIYAYMMAISTFVLLAFALRRVTIRTQLAKLIAVGAAVLLITSYFWIPFVTQTAYLSTSPYLQPEKFASYGAPMVLGWFASGELLDHGRLPVFTALLFVGLIGAILTRRRLELTIVALLVLWLWFYSGRAAIGPVFALLPLHDGLLFHRFIGGVDLAGIILIGSGGERVWKLLSAGATRLPTVGRLNWRVVALALAAAALFIPAIAERGAYYSLQTSWLAQTHDAIAGDVDIRTILGTLRRLPPGRVYAGLATNWGRTLDFGLPFNSVHVYQLLTAEGFATVAPPFGGQSINSDLQFDFDDQRPSQYDLYNVRYVVAAPSVSLPGVLVPLAVTGRYVLYAAPSTGYAELVSLSGTESVRTQAELFPKIRAFAMGADAEAKLFERFAFPARTDAITAGPVAGCLTGTVTNEVVRPARISVETSCSTASPAVFKVTYHPNWVVRVDGQPAATFMASPSYLGVEIPAGRHTVVATYESAPLKTPLLGLGGLTMIGLIAFRYRSTLVRW